MINKTMADLSGKHVLVVEDEELIALLVKDALIDAGATVHGPADCIDEARHILETACISAAVLDIDIGGCLVYPLADELSKKGIPYIFITGYLYYPERHALYNAPLILKPFSVLDIVLELSSISARRGK